jgi:hypothetical protein
VPGKFYSDPRYNAFHLGPLLLALSTNDYPRAWSLVKGLRSAQLRQDLQRDLVLVWSKREPRAALETVMSMPESNDRTDLVDRVLLAWGEKEPEAAIACVRQMPGGRQQNSALRSAIFGMANRDPNGAAKLLAGLPSGLDRDLATDFVAQRLAAVDPDAAGALLDRNPAGMMRGNSLEVVAGAKAARSIPETVAWAQTPSSPKDQAVTLGAVVATLAETNQQEAIQFAMSQSDPRCAGNWPRSWRHAGPLLTSRLRPTGSQVCRTDRCGGGLGTVCNRGGFIMTPKPLPLLHLRRFTQAKSGRPL